MRFTDNNAITAANMVDADILAGTDVSTGEDKKFPVGNLADYMLANRTQPVGGANQSITSAINAANSKADANTSAISDLETAVDKKADADGEYDNLVVGTSKQLLSDAYTEDFTPYKFRKAPYTDRLNESIVGASVAWNQLTNTENPASTISNITYNSSTHSFTATYAEGSTASGSLTFNIPITEGHRYLVRVKVLSATTGWQLRCLPPTRTEASYLYPTSHAALFADGELFTGESGSLGSFRIGKNGSFTTAQTVTFIPQVFDLTAMFGSTVADALYAMGADGIKLFRSWYQKDYYPYTEATLEHVSGLEAHEMVGFNQWDEEWEVGGISSTDGTNASGDNRIRTKNYIPILSGNDYYVRDGGSYTVGLRFYDSSKNYIGSDAAPASRMLQYGSRYLPNGTAYLRFILIGTATYNNDVCLNISDPLRNGTYKPYEKHTYALDASLTLRGILKYDSSKGIYADGDTYAPDGTVTRKWGSYIISSIMSVGTASTGINVARIASVSGAKSNGYIFAAGYQNSNNATVDRSIRLVGTDIYVYDNRFTDNATALTILNGLEAVYELATPTTESAEPYDEIQITDGTEEYVTDCLAPVGHESRYYENLRSKIEGLPTDFSAIICATEPTSKASRNYAVGDYLIYENTLYKVITAIAANATLTVGTNITATTIMAEIKALQ